MNASPHDDWLQGDGGPTVLLQHSAAARWQGAADFENSPMNCGSTETDYDAICACQDGVSVIRRYGQDMLVLSDSEWATRFMPSTNGDIVVLQWFGSDDEPQQLVRRLTTAVPDLSLPFEMEDTTLRLVVGADTGSGELYGYLEAPCTPGHKMCKVYFSQEAQVVVVTRAEQRLGDDSSEAADGLTGAPQG